MVLIILWMILHDHPMQFVYKGTFLLLAVSDEVMLAKFVLLFVMVMRVFVYKTVVIRCFLLLMMAHGELNELVFLGCHYLLALLGC